MKAEILQILEMQSEGKLTKDQAAELLAVLADQAREKDGAASTTAAPSREAPGPRGDFEAHADDPRATPRAAPAGKKAKPDCAPASAALHDLVDSAIGMGATVGRVATNWGTEFLNMVHRDEGGNSITLSKVESPAGEGFSFRGNIINASKVLALALHQAEVTGNNINASKVDQVSIRRGRFTQCEVNVSSVGQITIEGPEAIVLEGHSTDVPATGMRAVVFNTSKCSRVKVMSSSHLEASSLMSSVMKDWELLDAASVKGLKLNDSTVTGVRLTKATLSNVGIERSAIHSLTVREAVLEDVKITGTRSGGLSINGGRWKNVTFRRDALASGSGGRASSAEETLFENCTLTNCEFAGCTFRRSTFRNLSLIGISVRNVDFTGHTLETEEDFRRAAGL